MTAASANLRELANDLAQAAHEAPEKIVGEVIREYAERIAAEARQLAPFKTGRLKNSITVSYPNVYTAVIGPHVDYGPYQEYGTGSRGEFPTGSYVIRPKAPGGKLKFQVDGKTVFAKQVVHPGIKAHPYMRPATVNSFGDMAAEMEKRGTLLITQGTVS